MKQIIKLFNSKNTITILYALVATGVVLMLFPHGGGESVQNNDIAEEENATAEDTERELEQILSKIENVGKTEVMITYKNNGNITVAQNIDEDNGDNRTTSRREIVLTGDNAPVILSENTPEIEGVVIVAQGGDNAEVKNSLIRAAQALLGVEAHKIEVLKMKTED